MQENEKKTPLKLVVLPEQGGSLRSLRRVGQERRFIDFYLNRYKETFEQVTYFSYENEQTPPGVTWQLVTNQKRFHRWLYAFCMPLVHRRIFQECDVIRVMQLTGVLPALLAKLLYRKPVVATYGYHYSRHAFLDKEYFRVPLFWIRERLTLPFLDRVIVTTPSLYRYIQRVVKRERILFIPNSVDTGLFSPSHPRQTEEKRRILFVGRLSPSKNVSLLIEAASRLKDRIHIVLVGEGPLKKSLESQAHQKQISVEFKGTVAHEALPEELRRADCFVLPSRSEGHPKALLEAMSCGLPCIGTDIEGIRDLVQDGRTGLLCQQDPSDLAAKLHRLIQDRALAETLGKNARDYMIHHYDMQEILDREIQYLKSLTNGKGS